MAPRPHGGFTGLRRELEAVESKLKTAREHRELLFVAAVGLGVFPLLALLRVDSFPLEIASFGTLMWAAIVAVALGCGVAERRFRRQHRRLMAEAARLR